jgi:hypothetical protein
VSFLFEPAANDNISLFESDDKGIDPGQQKLFVMMVTAKILRHTFL